MFSQRMLHPLIAAAPLVLMTGYAHAQDANSPAVIGALKGQGVEILQEFDAGGHVRGFAGVAGGQPIAVYVLPDGHAIAGTRLDPEGRVMDKETLEKLAAKPMSDQDWALLEFASWVSDGAADAPRVVYTFTDANCPYCHLFWQAARPWVESGKVQLRHLLVGIIKEDSPAKAAAILDASDPSAALRENEINYDRGGIKPAQQISEEVAKTLEDNQFLMVSLGFRGTPGIVVRNDDGLIQKYNGMPREDALIEVLGAR